MLEGIPVVGDVIVVVVRIGKEMITCRKDVFATQVGTGQSYLLRITDLEHLLRIVAEILAHFIPQVGIGVLVANHLLGRIDPNGAMIGGENHFASAGCNPLEQFQGRRVLEPGTGQASVGSLTLCQFPDHLTLGTGMGKHIDKVQYHHIQLVLRECRNVSQQFLAILRIVHFRIAETVFLPETVDLCLDEGGLVQVLALFALLIHPQVGKHLLDLGGHQAGEDGIACILGGCRQNAVIELFVECVIVGQQLLDHTPLVQPEIIDQDKEDLFTLV